MLLLTGKCIFEIFNWAVRPHGQVLKRKIQGVRELRYNMALPANRYK